MFFKFIMSFWCILLIIFGFGESGISYAQNNKKYTLAILDFVADGVPEKEAIVISGLLRSYSLWLIKSNQSNIETDKQYTIIDQNQIDKILKLFKIQSSYYDSDQDVALLGKKLQVDGVITGSIIQSNNKKYIDVRLVDVRSAKTVRFKKNLEYDFSKGDIYFSIIPPLCKILFGIEEIPPGISYRPPIGGGNIFIPGSVQIHAGHINKGYIISGLQIITLAEVFRTTISLWIQNNESKDVEKNYMKKGNFSQDYYDITFKNWQKEYDRGKNIRIYRMLTIVATLGVYSWNIYDAYKIEKATERKLGKIEMPFNIEPDLRNGYYGIYATMRF